MPLEFAPAPARERAAELNLRHGHRSGADALAQALAEPMIGPVALVSSFGAESVVLLHMVSRIDPGVTVLFLDTRMLFPETLKYQSQVAEKLKLKDVRVIRPDRDELLVHDVDGILHLADTDACCTLRKVRPLARALEGFDGWITGRKRFHGGARQDLDLFEAESGRIKVNPLAHWTREDVAAYMSDHGLPRHPLVARGYPSVGCAPCTTKANAGEDPRAGRWRESGKTECGIHFLNGRAVAGPLPQEDYP